MLFQELAYMPSRHLFLSRGSVFMLLVLFLGSASAASLPSVIDLNTSPSLALQNVMRLNAEGSQEKFGSDLSNGICYGDFNGDGFDDMAIGSPEYDYAGRNFSGKVTVILGDGSVRGTKIDLGKLPVGVSTTLVYGSTTNEVLGASVTSGDFNQDGFDDLAMGAPLADYNGRSEAGRVYILYGSSKFANRTIDMASAVGTYGELRIMGGQGADIIDQQDEVIDFQLGSSLAAGDINADGCDDIVIGAPLADPGGREDAGMGFIVYGKSALGSGILDLNDAPGTHGETRFIGNASGGFCGFAVATGDFTGDGFQDVMISAPDGSTTSGSAYIVFGSSNLAASGIDFSTSAGRAQAAIFTGATIGDTLGYSLASGDINNDGRDEAIIGARLASAQGRARTGVVYLFPGGSFQANAYNLASAEGTYGETRIYGEKADDLLGQSCASSDINGDGYDDLVLSAPGYDPPGGRDAGAMFVISGQSGKLGTAAGTGSVLSLAPNRNGVRVALFGDNPNDRFGYGGEAGGDMNRDGFAEFSGSAFTDDYEEPQVDNNLEYSATVFGAGTAASASRIMYFAAGSTPVIGFGGRLSPVLRAYLAYTGGDGGSGKPSKATMTLTRSLNGITIQPPRQDLVLPAYWKLTHSRTTFTNATVRVQYTDAELGSVPENSLKLYFSRNATGPWRAPAQSRDNARNTIQATIFSAGYLALAAPVVIASVSPSTQDFGQWNINNGALNKQVNVVNLGLAPLTFTAPGDLSGTDVSDFSFVGSQDLSNLLSGGTRSFTLAFNPSTLGAKSATLRIHTNDPSNPIISLALTGQGINSNISVPTTALDWGARVVNGPPSPIKTVTIQNTGTTPLEFSSIQITGTGAAQFIFATALDSTPIAAGASRTLSLQFAPKVEGTLTASLQINSNDSDQPVVNIPLNGVGLANAAVRRWNAYR